jgi:hypothetical protein
VETRWGYLRVDPDNRLVADSLEADWNDKLRLLTEAQQVCEQQRVQDRKLLDEEQRAAILSLAYLDSTNPDPLSVSPDGFTPFGRAACSDGKLSMLDIRQVLGSGHQTIPLGSTSQVLQ